MPLSQDAWENIALVGEIMVGVGVALEFIDWISKIQKRNRNEITPDHEPGWKLAIEFLSIFMVVIGLGTEIWGAYKASSLARIKIQQLTSDLTVASKNITAATNRVGELTMLATQIETTNAQLVASNLQTGMALELMRSNNLVMDTKVRDLAHLYDQSTNALAEANARLASVRPLKDRLVDFLNQLNPKILPALQSGNTKFSIARVPEYVFTRLKTLQSEKGADAYISGVINMNEVNKNVFVGSQGSEYDLVIELKPALAQ